MVFLYRKFHPEIFQGWKKKKSYFEGWYFKVVNRDRDRVFAFIPGVSYDVKGQAHSFVQFFDGVRSESEYYRFPIGKFSFSKKDLDVRIGRNHFTRDGFEVDLKNSRRRVKGAVRLTNHFLYPSTKLSPGAMGPFSFFPFMECYHGIVSMNCGLDGELKINGEGIGLSGGRAYIEKDWGRSFPEGWVWLQSNHFKEDGISLMASVAVVPYLFLSFPGFIVAFLHNGKLHRFTTYTGAKIVNLKADKKHLMIHLKKGKLHLEISSDAPTGTSLVSPNQGAMTGKINESLTAEIHVNFYSKDKSGMSTIFKGTGRCGGLEIAGDTKAILK